MADVVCTPFIPKNISAYLKSHLIRVDNETVREYMRYITDSYLAYQVPKYDIKAKKRFEFVSKYYLSDHGIKNALIGIDTRSL